jgi:predicted ABC-type ATPase
MAFKRIKMVAGPNGSGKSTVVYDLLADHPEWLGVWINADEIEVILRAGTLDLAAFDIPQDPQLHDRLRTFCASSGLLGKAENPQLIVDAMQLHGPLVSLPQPMVNAYVAGTVADFIRHELLRAGVTFTFETVMSSPDKIQLMRDALNAGKRTCLYFVGTSSPDINVDRVDKRVRNGGHPVPESHIRQRCAKSLGNLQEACAAATRADIFDNSGNGHVLVAEIDETHEVQFPAEAIPAWLADTSWFAGLLELRDDPGPA